MFGLGKDIGERGENGSGNRSAEKCVSADGPPEVFKVGIKVPPFYPEEPEIWFAQLEGQFALANITSDSTKFYYVMAHLDHQYAKEIKDIIINPPATHRYEKLRSELVNRLSASRTTKIKQLLRHEEIGDRKPSQFFRHLRDLAGAELPDEYLQTLWLSRLPVNVQSVLAGQSSATLEEQAELADRIMEIAAPALQVHEAAASSSGNDELRREVAEIRKQLEVLTTKFTDTTRSRPRHRQRSRSRGRSQSSYRKYPVCFYHKKFGNRAYKCVKPCDFKTSENSKGSR